MKVGWVFAVFVLGVTVGACAEVVISDDFTVGNNDNVHSAVIAGTVTDVGGVTWRSNASGNWRFVSNVGDGGGAVSQNNVAGANPRLYLDYGSIMDSGNVTTLSLAAQPADCDYMSFGFGVDDNLLSSSATAFWVKILSNGTVIFYTKNGGDVINLGSLDVTTAWNDVLDISLTYDQVNNQVSGRIAGPGGTNTLSATTLSFTPTFDQFNFELANEGGTAAFAGYFDDVVVDVIVESLSPYEVWADSFGISGSPDADPDFDYDGDGLPNIYEFGLGGNPTNQSDAGIVPEFSISVSGTDRVMNYVYPQLTDNQDKGLGYYLETCTNLVTGVWSNTGYTVTGTNVPLSGDFNYVTNNIPVDEDKKFIRLIIDLL